MSRLQRSAQWRTHAALGLVVASAAAAACFTLDRPATLGLDTAGAVFPMTLEAFRAWTRGGLPEWTDRFWGGFPLVGDPTTGALYLPHVVGFLLTPGPEHLRAFDVTAALHLGLFAMGTSYLVTLLGATSGAAIIAALLASLSGCMLWSAIAYQQVFLALAWWPWCFAAAERLTKPGARLPWPSLALGWIALAAQVLAGYPEYAAYAGPLVAGWVLLRRGALPVATRLAHVAALGVGALALALPQLLPTLAYLPETPRVQTPFAATVFALTPGMTWAMLWPLRDATTACPLFLGLATVGLALVGASTRRPGALALAVIATLGIVLALGDGTPLYVALHALPVFRNFRSPMKFFLVAEFAVCWLAGLGLTHLWRRGRGWGVLAGTLALVAIGERATYLGRWLPAMAALSAASDVPGIVRSVGRPPLVALQRDAPPALAYASDRACGNIPAVANVATVTGGNVGLPSLRHLWTLGSRRPSLETLIMLGAHWVIARPADCLPFLRRLGARAVFADADRCVLELPHPMGRYTLLYAATPVASVEDMITQVLRAPGKPTPIVVPPEESTAPDATDAPGWIDVVSYHPGHVRLRTAANATRWLVAHESWSPGWDATLDGRPVAIRPAAGIYFAVLVPSGQHEIVLRYRAPGLRLGLAIAILWSLATLGAILRARRATAVSAAAPQAG